MHQKLVTRLQSGAGISDQDRAALAALPHTIRTLSDRDCLLKEGDAADRCVILISGFLYRRKIIGDRSQILSLHVPGDIPDLMTLYLPVMDHDLCSVGPSTVALVSHSALRTLLDGSPPLVHALWRETLLDAASFRQWVGSLGSRDAIQRIAHIFCEIAARLEFVGLLNENSFAFPLIQADIAAACGLSAVHTNRTLQALRQRKLLEWREHTVVLPNRRKLEALADFNPDYLQPKVRPS
jgi:CRP-like cAMP-binding protein